MGRRQDSLRLVVRLSPKYMLGAYPFSESLSSSLSDSSSRASCAVEAYAVHALYFASQYLFLNSFRLLSYVNIHLQATARLSNHVDARS